MSKFKVGPLDSYRNKASCTIDDLQSHFDEKECIEMRNRIWKTLEKDPLFKVTEEEASGELSLDEYRRLTHLRSKRICQYQFVTIENYMQYPLVGSVLNNAIGMFNWDCITRYLIHLTVSPYLFFLQNFYNFFKMAIIFIFEVISNLNEKIWFFRVFVSFHRCLATP